MIEHMKLHDIAQYHFRGFIVDFAQTDWNAMCMVFGSRNAKQPMEGMEWTCDSYLDLSLEQHNIHMLRVFSMHSIH